MSVERFFVSNIQIKRRTGVDMYGKPQYTVISAKAKVEEELVKTMTITGEKMMGLSVIYTNIELKPTDLVSVDGINFYPIVDILVAKNSKGEIVFYKGYCLRGNINV